MLNRHLLEVLIYAIAIDEILPSRLHFSEVFYYFNLSDFIGNCSFGVAVVSAESPIFQIKYAKFLPLRRDIKIYIICQRKKETEKMSRNFYKN